MKSLVVMIAILSSTVAFSKTFYNPKHEKIMLTCESDLDAVCRSKGLSKAVDVSCKSVRIDRPVVSAVVDTLYDAQDFILCIGAPDGCMFAREQMQLKPALVMDKHGETSYSNSYERVNAISKLKCE